MPTVPPQDSAPYPGISESPADTGRMRHGWHDFSHYDISMCEGAVQMAIGMVWRRYQDTATMATRARGAIPPAVTRIAERCSAGVLPAAVHQILQGTADLALFWPAYTLELALDQDDQATALLHAQLAHTRRALLGQLARDLWAADTGMQPPYRLRVIERDTALFDSLARDADAQHDTTQAEQFGRMALEVRAWLVQYWLQLGDTAALRSSIEAHMAACTRLHVINECGQGNELLTRLVLLQHGVHSPEFVAALKHNGGFVDPFYLFLEQPFVWPVTPYWYSSGGEPVAPPSAEGASPAAAVVPGKVTLVWYPASTADDHLLFAAAVQELTRTMRVLRRLMARYGPEGLQLVVIEHTRGAAWGTGAAPPDREAPALRKLYQERFRLPAAVVVDTTPHQTLYDGRRHDLVTAWERRYSWSPFSAAMAGPFLLDRHGRIRLYDPQSFRRSNDVPVLELFIRQLLAEP